jgi:hypothetical protein
MNLITFEDIKYKIDNYFNSIDEETIHRSLVDAGINFYQDTPDLVIDSFFQLPLKVMANSYQISRTTSCFQREFSERSFNTFSFPEEKVFAVGIQRCLPLAG